VLNSFIIVKNCNPLMTNTDSFRNQRIKLARELIGRFSSCQIIRRPSNSVITSKKARLGEVVLCVVKIKLNHRV